ncbi:MAG: phytanoyl-CoA dioxygenase family protein [Candidatus Harrisonbacteria bacterium]|nr:phytanoyl-CoA dioxygenase family protein [Candidatus Harrisonbacteria bacterium]
MWFGILNKEGRLLYDRHPKNHDSVLEKIIKEIKEKGIAVTHLDELFPGRNLLPELQSYTKKLAETAQIKKGKEFLMALWETAGVLDLDNSLVKLSLQSRSLEVVNAYMEMFSKFRHASLNVTIPMPEGSLAIKSQRWHRDPEDKRMCKMFVYLNDIDEDAGPFIYIPKSHQGGKWREIFPQRPPVGYYPPDGAVEKVIPSAEIKVCTGRAGTVIFGDTSGLHKGGYAKSKERYMFTATYSSKASLWQTYYALPSAGQLTELNLLARYAVTK